MAAESGGTACGAVRGIPGALRRDDLELSEAEMSAETDRAMAAGMWWAKMVEQNNEKFLPLLFDRHRYLVLMGGAGSGKSIFAGRKVLERCATEPGHRFLVCRKVGRTIRESCFNQLVGQATEHYRAELDRIYRGDMRIKFRNGSEILFSGLDDVEKLKSIYNITGIWIEEASELSEQDFQQLDIRLRGETRFYKQIIISFNPVSVLHWLKKRFFDTPDERVVTSHSTYKDNRFLDAENIRVLESFRDTDEYYYAVYCLGQWGVLGRTVFDAAAVTARLAEEPEPLERGYFLEDEWVEDPGGDIAIYAYPIEGRHYVIGADTAGEGSDWFVAQVLDNRTGEQVAVLRQRTDEDIFTRQVYDLGWMYNTALIGVETNWSTYPIRELERLEYPKQYVREAVDTYTGRLEQRFGFRTDLKSRPLIIAELITWMRENPESVSDVDTLQEMLTFVRSESYRPEAQEGAHDDCIMALAIAHHIRAQQEYEDDEEQVGSGWTADMWEDYYNAAPDIRRMLLDKWGNPEE